VESGTYSLAEASQPADRPPGGYCVEETEAVGKTAVGVLSDSISSWWERKDSRELCYGVELSPLQLCGGVPGLILGILPREDGVVGSALSHMQRGGRYD
jgi:hypothetical protein